MNYIVEYNAQIVDGLVVCDKIRKTYNHIVRDIINNPNSKYEFDEKKAYKVITFIESYCKHSKGKMAGTPFLLELWQKAAVSVIFGIVDKETRLRKYRFAFLMVARKNGKSTLAAAIGLYLLMMDGEGGPEVVACATVKDQAKIIWSEAVKMIRKSPSLRKRAKTKVSEIVTDYNEGSFKPLGRDSDTKDGLNISGATLDEIESWTDQNLLDVIVDGTTARPQPLILATCTAGTVRESVFDNIYGDAEDTIKSYDEDEVFDEHSIYLIYELDAKNEWTTERNWYKANPGLGTVKNIDILRSKVEQAMKKTSLVKNLVCKDFNVRETAGEYWLSPEEFINYSTFKFENDHMIVDYIDYKRNHIRTEVLPRPRYGIGGYDLSTTTDLTCATVIFKVPGCEDIFVKQMYWLPSNGFEERVQEDRRIKLAEWHEQGLLRLSEGNKIDYKDVTAWFKEIQDEYDIYIFKGGYDAWSAQYLVLDMEATFGKGIFEPVIQGKKTLSSPMQSLGEDFKSKKIIYDNNYMLRWCLGNVSIDMDKNGNIQPIKGRDRKKRIDGFASLLDAYVEFERVRDDYQNIL